MLFGDTTQKWEVSRAGESTALGADSLGFESQGFHVHLEQVNISMT